MRERWLLVLAFASSAGCASVTSSEEVGQFEAFVLGATNDDGLPCPSCNGPCCTAARRQGRSDRPACLGIRDRSSGRRVLLEATPAVTSQLAELDARSNSTRAGTPRIDAVLLTHAHAGHCAGLGDIAAAGVAVYVTAALADSLRRDPRLAACFQPGRLEIRVITPGESFEPIPGLTVEAVAVTHACEASDTVAFKLRSARKTLLFAPALGPWQPEPGLEYLLLDGVDVAYVDGAHFDDNDARPRNRPPGPTMASTMRRLGAVASGRPDLLRFIHLDHTNPALTQPAIRRQVAARGFAVAEPGERVVF